MPVFLGPDEDENHMLTSDAYGTLAKVLGALRAHDTDTIEALADPRLRSARPDAELDLMRGEFGEENEDQEQGGEGAARVNAAAAGVLRFSTERDPAALAALVRLRVIDVENAAWRRGGWRRRRNGCGRPARAR
ncbi:hypothetical protein [Streptomyces sp. NPDC007070]|uniref:hypothetical protein n=1 Tax=Streptomyces sp. NPDC007070 TaxID=3154312 RepID=UPI0033D8BBFA